MTILAILILAAIVVAYVGYPVFVRQPAATRRRPEQLAGDVPDDAGEFELDRATGRMTEDDFDALRSPRTQPVQPAPRRSAGGGGAAADEDEIERRVRALRQQRAAGGSRPKPRGQEHRR